MAYAKFCPGTQRSVTKRLYPQGFDGAAGG